MNKAQEKALADLHRRYGVEFHPTHFTPQFDLPPGYVAGWVGLNKLYVGVSPEGDISS